MDTSVPPGGPASTPEGQPQSAAATRPSDPELMARHPVGATATLCLGLFLLGMDFTVLNVAIPSLQRSLLPTMAQVQWIIAGYALALGGLVLTAGALSDHFGRRRFFLLGLAVLALASIVGAFAVNPAQVIGARCGTGVGAALLMPSTLSIISNLFPDPRHRERAIAAWASVAGIGAVTGPVVGGFLIQHSSWRATFWINPPLCAVIAVLALILVPESRGSGPRSVDPVSTALSATGLLTLLWAIIEAPVHGWTNPQTLGAFGISAALLIAFVHRQPRLRVPLLPLDLLRNVHVSIGAATLALLSFAVFGALFIVALYLQNILGYSAWQAGVRIVPLAAAMAVGAVATIPFASRRPPRIPVLIGLALTATAFVVLVGTEVDSGYSRILCFLVLAGLGAGLIAPSATGMVMGAVPRHHAGTGSAINDATRQLGSALGVAVQGSLLATIYTTHLTGGHVPTTLGLLKRRHDFVEGMTTAAWAGLIALLIALLAAWYWMPRRRRATRYRRPLRIGTRDARRRGRSPLVQAGPKPYRKGPAT